MELLAVFAWPVVVVLATAGIPLLRSRRPARSKSLRSAAGSAEEGAAHTPRFEADEDASAKTVESLAAQRGLGKTAQSISGRASQSPGGEPLQDEIEPEFGSALYDEMAIDILLSASRNISYSKNEFEEGVKKISYLLEHRAELNISIGDIEKSVADNTFGHDDISRAHTPKGGNIR